MGNCQAADAATVAIHHPAGTKVEKLYWSVSAQQIMSANPGHYVAHVIAESPPAAAANGETGTPSRQLRLLRPDDTLHIGQVYRLVSFEDVLKEFAAKKCVKMEKLLKRCGGVGVEPKKKESRTRRGPSSKRGSVSANDSMSIMTTKEEQEFDEWRSGSDGSSGGLRGLLGGGGGRRWEPSLQSISEIGL